jgi:hypothetical protein
MKFHGNFCSHLAKNEQFCQNQNFRETTFFAQTFTQAKVIANICSYSPFVKINKKSVFVSALVEAYWWRNFTCTEGALAEISTGHYVYQTLKTNI